MCDIITTIQDAIYQIEEDYHVKVIYAIECGSRLWGFSAANSDYDVRCLCKAKRGIFEVRPISRCNTSKSEQDSGSGWLGLAENASLIV